MSRGQIRSGVEFLMTRNQVYLAFNAQLSSGAGSLWALYGVRMDHMLMLSGYGVVATRRSTTSGVMGFHQINRSGKMWGLEVYMTFS